MRTALFSRFKPNAWSTALLAGAALALPAQGALLTLSGSAFDVTYDDTRLGRYSAPTLVNNVLFFSANTLVAESLNGMGAVFSTNLLDGVQLRMHAGYRLGGLDAGIFGDYQLDGAGSSVSITGSLTAADGLQPFTHQATTLLQVNPATPLGLGDGLTHDWSAIARLDAGTATALGHSNPFALGATTIDVALSTTLRAETIVGGSGLNQAFIEQKFAGLQLVVRPVATVPEPGAPVLVLCGLALMGWFRRPRPCSEAARRPRQGVIGPR